MIRAALIVLTVTAFAACTTNRQVIRSNDTSAPPDSSEMSGFLDDYSKLRSGPPNAPTFAYRNPSANWAMYDKILFEPVTIWRSGEGTLEAIPEADLKWLGDEFEQAVRARLGVTHSLVGSPGPGVMRVRLGITAARQADPVLDVFTFEVPPEEAVPDTRELTPSTRTLLAQAAIEGEFSDSTTGEVLAAGVDRSGDRSSLKTWGDVRSEFDRWAAWLSGRLQQLSHEPPRMPLTALSPAVMRRADRARLKAPTSTSGRTIFSIRLLVLRAASSDDEAPPLPRRSSSTASGPQRGAHRGAFSGISMLSLLGSAHGSGERSATGAMA